MLGNFKHIDVFQPDRSRERVLSFLVYCGKVSEGTMRSSPGHFLSFNCLDRDQSNTMSPGSFAYADGLALSAGHKDRIHKLYIESNTITITMFTYGTKIFM